MLLRIIYYLPGLQNTTAQRHNSTYTACNDTVHYNTHFPNFLTYRKYSSVHTDSIFFLYLSTLSHSPGQKRHMACMHACDHAGTGKKVALFGGWWRTVEPRTPFPTGMSPHTLAKISRPLSFGLDLRQALLHSIPCSCCERDSLSRLIYGVFAHLSLRIVFVMFGPSWRLEFVECGIWKAGGIVHRYSAVSRSLQTGNMLVVLSKECIL